LFTWQKMDMKQEAVADVIRSDLSTVVVDPDSFAAYLCSVIESDASLAAIRPLLESVLDSSHMVDEVGGQILLAYQAGRMGSSATIDDADDAAYFVASQVTSPVLSIGSATTSTIAEKCSSKQRVASKGRAGKQKRGAATSAADAALQAELLAGFSTAGPSTAAPSRADVPVCRHFVQGNCLLRDCAFSHDLASIPCRYWLTPEGCTRQNCTFWHPVLSEDSVSVPSQRATDEPAASSTTQIANTEPVGPLRTDAIDDDCAFDDNLGLWLLAWLQDHPDLQTAEETPAAVALDATDAAHFPALPIADASRFVRLEPATELHSSSSTKQDYIAVQDTQSLASLLASKVCFASKSAGGSGSARPSQRLRPAPTVRGAGSTLHERTARNIAESLEWVGTGDSVSSLYKHLRAEAEALAKSRNLAFHRATQAFLAGHKVEAARIAKQGRELQTQMTRAHTAAAGAIFAARNGLAGDLGSGTALPSPTFAGGVNVCVFDLHGLHPSEAADVARGAVAMLRAPVQWAAFLTGTRHHSRRLGQGGVSLLVRDLRF
jgi:hypothetical protein